MTRFSRVTLYAPALAVILAGSAAAGDPVEVKMLDRGPDGTPRVFDPDIVYIEPGDSVYFAPVDLGHDVRSLDALRPEGAENFNGWRNAPLEVTLEAEGIHVYECESHRTKGMVGVVVVGDPSVNLDQIKAKMDDAEELSEQGRERLQRILDGIETGEREVAGSSS